MIQWQHKLNGVEISEPISFADIIFQTIRDEVWHGVFFEASTSQLSFYGLAFDILKTAKEQSGVDAEVVYTADSKCEGETEYTNVITGKLDFSNYQETCGAQCLIRLSVEQDTCAMIFKNRFDQKVNVDIPLGFDQITNIPDYAGIGFNVNLATQVIPIAADAQVSATGDTLELLAIALYDGHRDLLMRPTYTRVADNSILTGYLDDPANVFQDPDNTFLLTPQVLLEDNPGCINQIFTYNVRLKGNLIVNTIVDQGTNIVSLHAFLDYWDGVGTHVGPGTGAGDAIVLDNVEVIANVAGDGSPNLFDVIFTGTVNLPVGSGLYAYMKINDDVVAVDADITADYHMNWDAETSFFLTTDRSCPPTACEVYLINETFARVTEAITNNCLTIKSDYYGRVDSEPFVSDENGCGGLRVFTPGLRIRQANDKNFFASMKELMEGVRGIDNIGMGMSTWLGRDVLRIEQLDYFYQDVEVLNITYIPTAVSDIESSMIYSNIKYGYNKWEIKSIKGIDEYNSLKQARTGIKSVNNELDISSNLITSGYIIENLRTTTLLSSGETDNTYDNDIFLICVERLPYEYIVEQGITEDAANFYSPATAYNWRVRPISNLMRWFRSIANCYTNLSNTVSKIFFTSGTGNYEAEGQLNGADPCKIENKVMAENSDIAINDFKNTIQGTPLYKAETVTFTYPLSIRDYKAIKSNPYGYITVQCGTGTPYKAFIKTIQYKPAAGTADFVLIKAWQ